MEAMKTLSEEIESLLNRTLASVTNNVSLADREHNGQVRLEFPNSFK